MKTKHTITAAVLALAAACAQADPYAITYESTISSGANPIPGLIDGQRFTLTLVMDNDGNSAANEAWGGNNLTCAIWRINDAANVVAAHDMVLAPAVVVVGHVRTDASGALTEMFSVVNNSGGVPAAVVRTRGLPPGETLGDWNVGVGNGVLWTAPSLLFMTDVSGIGVQITPAHWSSPVPFTGNCLDAAGPAGAGGGVASVPTLGHAGLALLSAFVGGLGLRMRRRNS